MAACMMATAFRIPPVCAVQRPGSRILAPPLNLGRLRVRRKYQQLQLQLVPGAYTGPVCLFGFKKQPKLPEIVQAGDPVLHEPAREVLQDELSTDRVQGIIDNMVAVMRQAPAVGLAAPQIGVPLQIIVLEDTAEYISYASPQDVVAQRRFPFDLLIIINPKLKSQGTSRARFFEGCLSVDGYRALVERHLEVEVSGLDRHGHPIVVRALGWQARILQHECDHLRGHLYVEKMISRTFRTVKNLLLPLPEGCPKPGACEPEFSLQAGQT